MKKHLNDTTLSVILQWEELRGKHTSIVLCWTGESHIYPTSDLRVRDREGCLSLGVPCLSGNLRMTPLIHKQTNKIFICWSISGDIQFRTQLGSDLNNIPEIVFQVSLQILREIKWIYWARTYKEDVLTTKRAKSKTKSQTLTSFS